MNSHTSTFSRFYIFKDLQIYFKNGNGACTLSVIWWFKGTMLTEIDIGDYLQTGEFMKNGEYISLSVLQYLSWEISDNQPLREKSWPFIYYLVSAQYQEFTRLTKAKHIPLPPPLVMLSHILALLRFI